MTNSHEHDAGDRPQVVIDLSLIRDNLTELFTYYNNPTVEALGRVLEGQAEPLIIDASDGLELIKTGLTEVGQGTALKTKQAYLGEVQAGYPRQFDADQALVSHRQYAKRHELDGGQRARLRTVEQNVSRTSKSGLIDTIVADRTHAVLGIAVSEAAIEANFMDIGHQVQTEIGEIVERIARTAEMPEPETGIKKLASFVTRKSVKLQAELAKKTDLLEPDVARLTKLIEFAKTGTSSIADILINYHAAEVEQITVSDLLTRYQAMAQRFITELAPALDSAYDSLRLTKQASQPRRLAARLQDTEEMAIQPLIERPQDRELSVIEESSLGEIDSPFPWLSGAKTEVTILRNGNDVLLFCDAMTPDARAVSNRVQAETESGAKLPSLLKRMKEIELKGHASLHPAIKKIRNGSFYGLTVCYYTNNRSNGTRTYYARTTTKRYPAIEKLAGSQNLDPATPFIILLAETDKAHQLKTMAEFGIDRIHGRVGRAGSI